MKSSTVIMKNRLVHRSRGDRMEEQYEEKIL